MEDLRTELESCFPERNIFDFHPNYRSDKIDCHVKAYQKGEKDLFFGRRTRAKDFFNPLHEEVILLPRDKFYNFRDDFNESTALDTISMPFSSYDFYYKHTEDNIFRILDRTDAFWRTGGIAQLGYLVAPLTEQTSRCERIYYSPPLYHHSRWQHQLVAAFLATIILARNGFSLEERAPIILACACHDIAMPAGGDSVVRIDPKNLCEEENFSWVLKCWGLDKIWQEKYGFDLGQAADWVKGKGTIGKLIDILDKISYTALDCYYAGHDSKNRIHYYCLHCPLVIDVWQDIRLTHDREQIYFADPTRLYNFLYLRALEHDELLLNPRSRALDFYLTKYVSKLYRRGIVTREQLLTRDNEWLNLVLGKHFPRDFRKVVTPDILEWKKFSSPERRNRFCELLGRDRIDHTEDVKPFKSGLDWLVKVKDKLVPLHDVISDLQVKRIEHIVRETAGYWVYYKKEGEENSKI